MYSVAVFLHVVGALGLFAALGVEWAGIANLRLSVATGQAREWLKLVRRVWTVELPSVLMLMVTGFYVSAATGGGRPWIGLGLLATAVITAGGWLLAGRRLRRVGSVLIAQGGTSDSVLARQRAVRVLTLSAWLRTALALGVVFIMSIKPDRAGALSALGIALVLGLAAGLLPFVRGPQAHHA